MFWKKVKHLFQGTSASMDDSTFSEAARALEVKEAIRVLKGKETGRFRDLCLHFAGKTLAATGKGTEEDARRTLDSGKALEKAKEWFAAQGADLSVFETENWCANSTITEVRHEGKPGWIERVHAEAIGQAVFDMGGGRKRKEDAIDPTVGIALHVEVGDKIEPGQLVLQVHGSASAVSEAVIISESPIPARPILLT